MKKCLQTNQVLFYLSLSGIPLADFIVIVDEKEFNCLLSPGMTTRGIIAFMTV